MKSCNFFFVIFFIFTFIKVLDCKFTSEICNHDKPHIQFPFKVNSFCKNNITMINFQNYGLLGVKSISYDHKKLTLFDPKDCVFQVFMNLDLSSTPFRYYHVVKNYTYFNCSVKLTDSFEQVPCLSGSKHHVYVEDSSLNVPNSCKTLKTVLIPFAYSSYVSDDSFGLDLTWDSDGFNDIAEDKPGRFGFQSIGDGLSIVVLVLVVVGLAYVKAYYSKKSQSTEHEKEKLLGDLEIL